MNLSSISVCVCVCVCVCVFMYVCLRGVLTLIPIWHLWPVKPAKQEHVKEGFPVMQSSMHRPPFRQGLRFGQTEAED